MFKKICERVYCLSYPTLCSNVYFLEHSNGREVALIDSGSGENIADIKKCVGNRKISFILLTHGHWDHTGGLAFLDAKAFLSKKDFEQLSERNPKISALDFSTKKFDEFSLSIIETPGHTRGSLCFLEEKHGLLFSGDTLFADEGRGRTDLLGGSETQMKKSLAELRQLDYKVLCPGHGKTEKL